MLKQLLIGLLFALGLYYVTFGRKCIEGFSDEKQKYRCPNVLIQKGNEFYLYNSYNKMDMVSKVYGWIDRCPIY